MIYIYIYDFYYIFKRIACSPGEKERPRGPGSQQDDPPPLQGEELPLQVGDHGDAEKDRMVAFAARATVDATGGGPSDLDPQTAGIVEWLASTKHEEVMAFRERATQAVERLGEQMRQQGETADWLESADKALRHNLHAPICCEPY